MCMSLWIPVVITFLRIKKNGSADLYFLESLSRFPLRGYELVNPRIGLFTFWHFMLYIFLRVWVHDRFKLNPVIFNWALFRVIFQEPLGVKISRMSQLSCHTCKWSTLKLTWDIDVASNYFMIYYSYVSLYNWDNVLVICEHKVQGILGCLSRNLCHDHQLNNPQRISSA